MIAPGNIEDILYEDLKVFGIETFKKGAMPEGKVTKERIVILPGSLKTGVYWKKDFVEVNFCVPDVKVRNVLMADKSRLAEIERKANSLDSVGAFDGTSYRYSIYQTGQEHDPELECHYVNVKLLFEILNVN
jgi:hypothetical protein